MRCHCCRSWSSPELPLTACPIRALAIPGCPSPSRPVPATSCDPSLCCHSNRHRATPSHCDALPCWLSDPGHSVPVRSEQGPSITAIPMRVAPRRALHCLCAPMLRCHCEPFPAERVRFLPGRSYPLLPILRTPARSLPVRAQPLLPVASKRLRSGPVPFETCHLLPIRYCRSCARESSRLHGCTRLAPPVLPCATRPNLTTTAGP